MTDGIALRAPIAGWLAPLDEVSDPVFAERMMGNGFAIDPVEGALRAPADAIVLTVPASAHAVTLRLANGAELLIHIGLETVALGGEGFRALVKEGDRVRAGEPLIEFDLDTVAARAKSLITPVVLASGGSLAVERTGREVTPADIVAIVAGSASPAPSGGAAGERHAREVIVTGAHGIHARPAARIVAALRPFEAEVSLKAGAKSANARSTVALLGLGAVHGAELRVEGEGADARAAVDAVAALIASGLGDEVAAPAPVRRSGGPVCASPGLAIGRALQWRARELDVPRDGAGLAAERAALEQARERVADGLKGAIGEAHRALLHDPELTEEAERHIAEGRSAAFAWRAATAHASEAIRATGDPLLAERAADLKDLERQVAALLTGALPDTPPQLEPDTILVAEDLLPSEFLALDKARLAGIATAAGGPTAHVAILAASAGIPMLVAAGAELLDVADGSTIILDAGGERIIVDPAPEALAEAQARAQAGRERRARESEAAHQLCHMADGTRIEMFANLGSLEDAAAAVAAGAEGCGLLRTEFLFLEREQAPDEAEQAGAYAEIADALQGRPLIVRTLDIGGDKPVPYLPLPAEPNPALGLRGIRLGLARPDLLRTQLRAILRGVPAAQLRIMIAMVVDLDELRAVRAILDEVAPGEPVSLGVMIETPAAALLAESLAAEADFLSIGTNDLSQYALACDRGNAAVSQRIDALHPAVLRLIREVGRGAKAHGRWAGVCGGLASDPAAAPILIGLGITELSATPSAIPRLKAVVRELTMSDCEQLAARACAASTAAEVRALLRKDAL